jgi:uracil-DNA glycosylase family 4
MSNKPQPILIGTTSKSRLALFGHVRRWDGCVRCDIGKVAKHHVPGRGMLPADILFVGEGPGREEDAEGFAFVGPSGTMLQEWIDNANAASLFTRGRLFTWAVTNLVMCRPRRNPDTNRPPTTDEIHNCQPRLMEFIEMAEPKVFVSVGYLASHYAWLCPSGIPRINLVHPSSFLRSGGPTSVAAENEGRRLARWLLANLALPEIT